MHLDTAPTHTHTLAPLKDHMRLPPGTTGVPLVTGINKNTDLVIFRLPVWPGGNETGPDVGRPLRAKGGPRALLLQEAQGGHPQTWGKGGGHGEWGQKPWEGKEIPVTHLPAPSQPAGRIIRLRVV